MSINVIVNDFGITQVAPLNDGVVGIIVKGTKGTSQSYNTTYNIKSKAEYTNLGITDNVVNGIVDSIVANIGYNFYLMTTDSASASDILDKTKTYAKKLIDDSNGTIRLLACELSGTGKTYNTTGDKSIPKEIGQAINKAQALADAYEDSSPFNIFISSDGIKLAETGTIATYTDKNKVSLLTADAGANRNVVCGSLLGSCVGRLSATEVQEKLSKVLNGNLTGLSADIKIATASVQADFVSKKIISIVKRGDLAGFYANGDYTLADSNNNRNIVARGRVIDKAIRLIVGVLNREIDNDVKLNTDGTIDTLVAAGYEGSISSVLRLQMLINNNVSGFQVEVDKTNNVASTNQVNVSVNLSPIGYVGNLKITLGYNISS